MTSQMKRADLETQMRKKYMRMKAANLHENVKLERTKQELNKVAVNTLEQHLHKTVEMSDLWSRCSTTTGWFDDAVKPKRKDLRSSMMTDFKAKMTKPWMYSTQDTIETWEKRGHTTQNKRRPKTAIGTFTAHENNVNNMAASKQEASENNTNKRPHTTIGHTRKLPEGSPQSAPNEQVAVAGGMMLQQRAKTARLRFNNLNFKSPRLEDRHIKANTRPARRPSTAGAMLQSGGSQSSFVEQERKMASAVHRRKYDQKVMENDEVFETLISRTADGTSKPQLLSEKLSPRGKWDRIKEPLEDIKESVPVDYKSSSEVAVAPVVSFRRRESLIMATVVAKLQKYRRKSTVSVKSDTMSESNMSINSEDKNVKREKLYDRQNTEDDKSKSALLSDDENKENKTQNEATSNDSETADNSVKPVKKKKKKARLPKWNIPKFYIRPQERYRTEDMFLMRRYVLLQRQLASEMPPELLETPNLDINTAFSSTERKKELLNLVEKNSCKVRTEKKVIKEDGLKGKIEQFMDEIDKFIEQQKQTD